MPFFRERRGRLALFLGRMPSAVEIGGRYDHDHLEGSGGRIPRDARRVLATASCSASYFDRACAAADALGVVRAGGAYVLCDHELDGAPRSFGPDAWFLGNFDYDPNARRYDEPWIVREALEQARGARSELRVHAWNDAPLEAVGDHGGWTAAQLHESALPLSFLSSGPSSVERAAGALRSLGCDVTVHLVRGLDERDVREIDTIVRGLDETKDGRGEPWHSLVPVETVTRSLVAPSAASVLRARPAEQLREIDLALSDRSRHRATGGVGSFVELSSGERIVVDERATTFILADLDAGPTPAS